MYCFRNHYVLKDLKEKTRYFRRFAKLARHTSSACRRASIPAEILAYTSCVSPTPHLFIDGKYSLAALVHRAMLAMALDSGWGIKLEGRYPTLTIGSGKCCCRWLRQE